MKTFRPIKDRPRRRAICRALNALIQTRIAGALELDQHELAADWIEEMAFIGIKIRWKNDSQEFVV